MNTSEPGPSKHDISNGRLTIRNIRLRYLIAEAWTIDGDQVYGPAWLDDVRVDVVAKTPSLQTPDAEVRAMLQTLLRDRMKMVTHIEQREKTVWALSLSKGAPKMTPSKPPAKPEDSDCKWSPLDNSANRYVCTHMTMTAFAHEMSDFAGRELCQRVVDQTGLRGARDFTLDWTPQAQLEGKGGLTLFAALRAQLGLQLESRKLPVPVVVIDSPVVVIDSMDRAPAAN